MKVDAIIQKMTLEEKIKFLMGKDGMSTVACERLGIPEKRMQDGPHGVRIEKEHNATAFPTLAALAASWDVKMAEKMGEALAKDCIEHDVDMLLGPGVNIKRTPLCGRNFEYFSEDPILAGEMSAGYINGLENQGVGTSLKHFAVNNQEVYRENISVEVDERTLREIYLRPFEIAVKKSKPTSVMCSYNKINAIWASENKFLLTDVLRGEWGYEGFVVSDWNAIHERARAFSAGMDLQMPEWSGILPDMLHALEEGRIKEADIDRAVKNVLQFALKEKPAKRPYDRDAQHKTARELAASGITLLKNDNNILPLTADKYKSITVIGEFADKANIAGQGSSEVLPSEAYTDSPLEELKKMLPNVAINYLELYQTAEMPRTMSWPKWWDESQNITGELVLFFVGTMLSEDTEMFDRRAINLSPQYVYYIRQALGMGKKVVVVLQTGSAVTLADWHHDVNGIVEMWLSGEGAGHAIAQVLCGAVNPSGKLPETFPLALRKDLEYPGDGYKVEYKERLDVGYRYYDKHPEEILYPFGHGLSYTEFTYSDLVIVPREGDFEVSFRLQNTGDIDGSEVVQLYVSDPISVVTKPLKELKHFQKIFLNSGEEKTIRFILSQSDFAYYNIMLHEWVTENGEYHILIGSSSQDIRLTGSLIYEKQMPYTLHGYQFRKNIQ